MIGIIYKVTCSVNGKIYIGQTRNTLRYRRGQHYREMRSRITSGKPISYFLRALRKHPPNTFTWEQIAEANSFNELNTFEAEWIAQCDASNRRLGYNCKLGGGGHPFSSEFADKIREAQLKIVAQPGYVNPFKGKHHSNATRQAWSHLRRGRPALNRGVRMKDSQRAALRQLAIERASKKPQLDSILEQPAAMPIVCNETGERFPSIRHCARLLGLSQSNLNQHILGNKKNQTVKGMTFQVAANIEVFVKRTERDGA